MRGAALAVACLPVAAGAACAERGAPYPADLPPTSGPSWLTQIGASLDQTLLARQGGAGRPPASARSGPRPGPRADVTFQVSGGDLYRLLCRSCHGPEGRGAPPQIPSAAGAAAAASPALTLKRMKARGTPIREEMARELARGARESLHQTLRQPGTSMPSFSYLRGEEIDAVILHLAGLAGAPVEVPRLPTRSSRVGALLVKGTCHLCHAATAADRREELGAYPVATLAHLPSMPEGWVSAKVRRGLPYPGSWWRGGRGRQPRTSRVMPPGMPVFSYLSAAEVAAAYYYLLRAPPAPSKTEVKNPLATLERSQEGP